MGEMRKPKNTKYFLKIRYLERWATISSLLLSSKVHNHAHKSQPMNTIFNHSNHVHTPTSYFSKTNFNIIVSFRLCEGNDKCLEYSYHKIPMKEGPLGRPESRWEDEYIIMNVGVSLIQQVPDSIQCRASVNTVLNLRV
jgi:hypothetical protein